MNFCGRADKGSYKYMSLNSTGGNNLEDSPNSAKRP